MLFDPEEIELINDVQVALLTGWTEEQIENTSPVMLAAVLAIAEANKELSVWQVNKTMKK